MQCVEVDSVAPGLGQDALDALHFAVAGLHLLRAQRLLRLQVHIALWDLHLLGFGQLHGHPQHTPTPHTRTHSNTQPHTPVHIHTHTDTQTHTHTHTNTHTHTHAQAHTHTHTRIP